MSNINSIISVAVSDCINEFSIIVSEKYNIPKDELLFLLGGISNRDIPLNKTKPVIRSESISEIKPELNINSEKEPTEGKCIHVFHKGEKQGSTCPSKSLEHGYCRKHAPKDKGIKEGKSLDKPATTKSPKSSKTSKASKKETSVLKKISSGDTIFYLSPWGNYIHKSTRLVLEGGKDIDKKNRKVIGKESAEGKILPLTAEDIDTCKSLQLRHDVPSNLTGEESEHDEEEVQEEVIEEEEETSEAS